MKRIINPNPRSGKHSQKRLNIDKLRVPWVPAPAKSSGANVSTRIPIMNSNASPTETTSNQSQRIPASTKAQASKSTREPRLSGKLQNTASAHHYKHRHTSNQRHVRKSSLFKKSRNGQHSTYKLQSKDSLVDVTACLKEKREEVMKLWEKCQLKNAPHLQAIIESANCLAVEAIEEVEKLRRTIHKFQEKDDGLSEADCMQLEQMRIAVLEKVKQFEQTDNFLQECIAKQSASVSATSERSRKSQTEHPGATIPMSGEIHSTLSLPHPLDAGGIQMQTNFDAFKDQEIIVLKEKTTNFSDDSVSEAHFVSSNVAIQSDAIDRKRHSKLSSIENLHGIRSFFEESMHLPPIEEIIRLSTARSFRGGGQQQPSASVNPEILLLEASNSSTHNHNYRQPPKLQSNQRVRFTESDTRMGQLLQDRDCSDDFLYREKISALQRQLMNTEHEVEELRAEVERIESDANFRVRILQNNVQDRFNSLQAIPDYLEMLDRKLGEVVQEKMKLEHALGSKEILIKEIKEQNKNLERETIALHDQLRITESSNDFLTLKNTDLEKSNGELKMQVEDLTKQVAQMSLEIKKREEYKTTRPLNFRNDFSKENQKLKLHCMEMREEINQAKKIILNMRKSKAKLVSSLNERIEELLDALQVAQEHKRILGDQIHNLKKSFHEPFPTEVFQPGSPMNPSSRDTCNYKRKKSKALKKCDEPIVQSTVAWKTGAGIKIDDLLHAKIF